MSGLADSSRIYIGLDDTDHPDFGCTTATFDELLSQLSELKGVVVEERRLVRLWPFAARRTRGNAALSAVISLTGNYTSEVEAICRQFHAELCNKLSPYLDEEKAMSPVLILSDQLLDESFYWSAVRGHVGVESARQISEEALVLSGETDWGLVGAAAAIAWRPRADSTWELIAWREEGKIGTKRKVPKSVPLDLDSFHPGTFLNRDPTADKGLIAPRTPCPVLYGLRGSSPKSVEGAHQWMQSLDNVEDSPRFGIHHTNQLSDDHLAGVGCATVISSITEKKGAHASVDVFDGENSSTLVAFKESGEVNAVLRSLQCGDVIEWAGLIAPDTSVHLERIRVLSRTPRINSRPTCCGKGMRSAGIGQSLRCKKCGRTEEKYWLVESIRSEQTEFDGWVEPTASQRRHLSKPLSHGLPQ